MNDKLKQVMGQVFEVTPDNINDESNMDSIDSWDSLSHINLVQELEKVFGVKIEFEEIVKMTTFSAVADVIKSKG